MKLSRTLLALLAVAGTAQAAQLTLYKQPNFAGDALTLRNDTTDLTGAGFQDQTSSVVVRSGRWQVCTQPNFQGDCSVLGPGSYSALDQGLNHRIESARALQSTARDERGHRYADRDNGYRGYDGYDSRDDYRDPRYLDNGTREDRWYREEAPAPDWRDRDWNRDRR